MSSQNSDAVIARIDRIGIADSLVEDQTEKCRVQQIAKRSGIYQRAANDKSPGRPVVADPGQIKCTPDHRNHPEYGKDKLPRLSAELPPPGHPVIFDEVQPKP